MINKLVKIGRNAALLIFSVVAFSCVSTRSLTIDIPVRTPGELPESVQSLTLVTQAVDEKYTNLESDSLQKLFFEKRFRLDTVLYDFQMADTTLKALGELLFESGRYDYVIPEDRFLPAPKTSFLATELSWDVVEELCEVFETDAVLSLDHLKTRVITGYDNETFFDPFQGGFNSAATATMKIQYDALFRVYDPAERKVLRREFITDTLYWEDADVSARNLFRRFTPVKQALTETGIVIALELTDKMAIRWRPERRQYFIRGNARLREANELAAAGDWRGAIAGWQAVVEDSGSKTLRSKAMLNIALGYEILGDVGSAISWALESYNTMYRPLTYEYLEILKRRQNELKNRE